MTPQVVPHTEGLSEKFLEKRPAVSYFRVSTFGQGDSDKSGLERQEEVTHNGWMSRYGHEWKLIENVTQRGISGAKAGRFEWFLEGLKEGSYEKGTCLLVERVSRFSRMKWSDTLKQLQARWYGLP